MWGEWEVECLFFGGVGKGGGKEGGESEVWVDCWGGIVGLGGRGVSRVWVSVYKQFVFGRRYFEYMAFPLFGSSSENPVDHKTAYDW